MAPSRLSYSSWSVLSGETVSLYEILFPLFKATGHVAWPSCRYERDVFFLPNGVSGEIRTWCIAFLPLGSELSGTV